MRASGSGSGSNTSTAARVAAEARTSVAWPPRRPVSARIAAAPASPSSGVSIQTRPPAQS